MSGSHRARPQRTSPRASSRTTRRAARLAAFLGVPAALIASGVFISNASYAAFSSTTVNPSSSWTTGTVALSNDSASTALFSVSGLKPGSTNFRCITVTSTGSLPASVKVYATSTPAANGLTSALTLSIDQGTGTTGGPGSCTGFTLDTGGALVSNATIDSFATKTSFGSGFGSWSPTGTGTESKVYRLTYTLPTTAPSTAQGLSASIGLTWESQNT